VKMRDTLGGAPPHTVHDMLNGTPTHTVRDTLNGLQPRTVRDAQRDPRDWVEHHRSTTSGLVLVFRVWLVLVGFAVATVWLAVSGK